MMMYCIQCRGLVNAPLEPERERHPSPKCMYMQNSKAEHDALRLRRAGILALYFAGFLAAGGCCCCCCSGEGKIGGVRRCLLRHRADRADFDEIEVSERAGCFFQRCDGVVVVVRGGGGHGGFGEEGGGRVGVVEFVVGWGVLFGGGSGADPVVRGRGWGGGS